MRESEFGRGNGVARRCVHDDDTALGGSFDVDVVHADTGATDNFEQRRGGENLARDLSF